MTVLGLHHTSYEAIRERLVALGLDLEIATFSDASTYTLNDRKIAAEEIEIDYLWLRTDINEDGSDTVFNNVLKAKRIGVLQTFNAGLDHPFYAELSGKGTRICNSSAQGVAIAEFVFGQVLSVLQPIEEQRQMQVDRNWRMTPYREISQTHWLVLGHGPIGQALTKRLKAFEADVSVIRRTAVPTEHADRVGAVSDLQTFLPDADIVVIACPLNDQTRGMADASFFRAMKPGAILVNIARGPLVDDAALIKGLGEGKPSTAILDVFHTEPLPDDDPLWTHPKVRMTPHTSFAGNGSQGRWDQLFLDNIARFVADKPLGQEVDPALI